MMRGSCAVCAVLLAACGTAEEPTAVQAVDDDPTCADRGVELTPELTLEAEPELEVTLVSLSPSSPVVGDNSWQVRLRQHGALVEGATLRVVPWMPDHSHGSTKTVRVSELLPGYYELSPINFRMPGYWEVGIDILLDGSELGAVSFDTCLVRK